MSDPPRGKTKPKSKGELEKKTKCNPALRSRQNPAKDGQRCSSETDKSPEKGKASDMAMEAEVREKPKEKESTEACTVAEAIAAIEKISGKVDASLKAAYHSKTEMVELAGTLKKWVGVCNRASVKAWLDKHRFQVVTEDKEKNDKMQQRVRNAEAQVHELRKENERLKERLQTEAQTEKAMGTKWTDTRGRNRLTTLEGVDTLEKWTDAANKEWIGEVYTNTSVVEGNPLVDTDDSIVKAVLVESTDESMEASIQKIFKINSQN
jgi:hypothetical protein